MPGVPPQRKSILYFANEDSAFLLSRLPMARFARDAGFDVHVATRNTGSASKIAAEGFVVHDVPIRRGSQSLRSVWSTLATILALRRITAKLSPSIVHSSSLQCSVIGSLAMLGRNIQKVNGITGLGYVFTSADLTARILKGVLRLVLPALFNRANCVVLVENKDDKKELVTLGIQDRQLIHIPGSGVDDAKFRPMPEPPGPITFAFVGRLLADKGIRALIAAHQSLWAKGHRFNLLIAGRPDPLNPASVSNQELQEWSNLPGISWLGHVDDVASVWRRSHFAVLPSRREGLPVSLLEAAACGRSMVATDAPGCRDIAVQDQTGFLVPIDDVSSLADAILRLAGSSELRAKFGQAARELVERAYSARVVGHYTVQLYRSLC